jgi:hypothetical protein
MRRGERLFCIKKTTGISKCDQCFSGIQNSMFSILFNVVHNLFFVHEKL